MRAIISISAITLSALIAGCHPSSDRNNSAAPVAAATGEAPDPIEKKIVAFPEPLRRTTFFRAIRDAGFQCQQVVQEAARDRDRGRAVWVAACEDGSQYILTLDRGGIINVSGLPRPKPAS